MKLERRPTRRKMSADQVLGLDPQPSEASFNISRDIPREDLQAWKDSLDRDWGENSMMSRIQVFSAAKLLDFFPEEMQRFRTCPWLKAAWIKYFQDFFKTMDYQSRELPETADAYRTAVDFMKVFPEARAELLAGRDTERDFQLLLQNISDHAFNIEYVPTMLQFWPDRRVEILHHTDPSLALADIRKYPGNTLGIAIPVMLVFPEYRTELGELMKAKLRTQPMLDEARRNAGEKYYEIPRYYELIQQLQLVASPDAHIDERGTLVVKSVRRLDKGPGLPARLEM